jgi:hypothetical protein
MVSFQTGPFGALKRLGDRMAKQLVVGAIDDARAAATQQISLR